MDSAELVKRIGDLTVIGVLIQQQLEILTRRLGVNRLNNEIQLTEPVVRIRRKSTEWLTGQEGIKRVNCRLELSLSHQAIRRLIRLALTRLCLGYRH